MLAKDEIFEIKSVQSYDISDSSCNDSQKSNSLESVMAENAQISETIKQMILEQKRRNFVSKTENFYQPMNLKRCHSASFLLYRRQSITLPYYLQKTLHSNRKCLNIATDDLLDSIYGAFFGFMVGDIVGAHIAYKTSNFMQIPSALLMNGGGTYNLGPGQGTDQTQILLSACYGMIEGGSGYCPDYMAKRYMKWLETKPFNVSAIFILSFVEIRKKKRIENKVLLQGLGDQLKKYSQKNRNHQSNLGLVRILPLVVWSLNLAEKQFHKLIREELSLICPNELVIETGLVYAMMLRIIFKTHDQQLAMYEASKWVYSRGSQKIRQLWRYIQLDVEIPSRGNSGKLKTCFTYSCIEINKKEVKFMDSLLKTLSKGGDTDANCAIVMALVGSITGYNNMPSYFKQKIINCRMTQSSKPRGDEFSPYRVIEIVEKLMKNRPEKYVKESSSASTSILV